MKAILVLVIFFGALLAPAQEQELKIKKESGEIHIQKISMTVAGKITLLPGDNLLVEGQPLKLTTLVVGGPSHIIFFVNSSEITLDKGISKSIASTGAVVTEHQDSIFLPEGEWKISVLAWNDKGVFSDTIRVRVIGKQPIIQCCPEPFK